MTALAFILVRLCRSEQRLKGAQSWLSCDHYRESHKTQVWLCFFILSVLSTSTHAVPQAVKQEIQTCLSRLNHTIQKSDALLYAPSIDDIGHCKNASLACYMLELLVVLYEEDIKSNEEVECILNFNQSLPSQENSDICPPCEAYPLNNTTVFLERLKELLQSMN
uniref:Interleukin n=1 Tax=Myripristis murdjan TaxID=586833 RepID=A0A667YDS8_9TELE